jgi:hypothetical protein
MSLILVSSRKNSGNTLNRPLVAPEFLKPSTMALGFKNNPLGQSELLNEFFCDQFSAALAYDIDIDYSNDSNFDIGFKYSQSKEAFKVTQIKLLDQMKSIGKF